MPRIVLNSCFGGFGLSEQALQAIAIRKQVGCVDEHDLDRTDPDLVAVVEELGRAADGDFARLRIADVPDGVDWYIDDYDGQETAAEKHRTW